MTVTLPTDDSSGLSLIAQARHHDPHAVLGRLNSEAVEYRGHGHSVNLSLPPLACLLLKRETA